jgi:hypothetical protein
MTIKTTKRATIPIFLDLTRAILFYVRRISELLRTDREWCERGELCRPIRLGIAIDTPDTGSTRDGKGPIAPYVSLIGTTSSHICEPLVRNGLIIHNNSHGNG